MLLFSDLENYNQKLIYIFQNVQITLGFIGLVSEILIIIVFRRKRLRDNSYAFYCTLIACFEITICLQTFRLWSAFMFDANIDLVSQFFCAISEYIPYTTNTTSLWLYFLISLDRVVTIAYSNRFQLLKKRWFQLFAIVGSFLMFIEGPLNFKLITIDDTNKTICSIPDYVFIIQIWTSFTNIFVINVVVINLLNFKMIHYLITTRNSLHLINSNRRSVIKDRKFALSTVCINIVCFISKTPLCVALLVSYYFELSLDSVRLLFTICVTINMLFYALSFGIYMLVNSIFYDEFYLMIGIKKSRVCNSSMKKTLK